MTRSALYVLFKCLPTKGWLVKCSPAGRHLLASVQSFIKTPTPVLNIHMLVSACDSVIESFCCERDWRSIKIISQLDAQDAEDSGSKISMRSDNICGLPLWHSRPSDDKWNVDVFLESTFLAGLQPVLSNVEAIIRSVNDISIIQNA
jgi:hypothetical protein